MKVLLIGEYNKTHKNIKLGLESLGHEAVVMGFRDGYKKVDVDIALKNYFENGFSKKVRIAFIKLFGVDLLSLSLKYIIKKKKNLLSNFDIIQFINEAPFLCDRPTQQELINTLMSWNNKSYLISCGTDYTSVLYAYEKKFRYSILTPYFESKRLKKYFSPALSYLTPQHIKLHNYIFNNIEGVISNDLDYHIPLLGHPKYLGMIPHAINLSELIYKTPIIKDKIIIFHGINTYNYYKKGNDIFDSALEIIAKKYPNQVEIVSTKNLPYEEYIKYFDSAHILLDQIYAYDQGYNALEAMAKGKVVFTGAEKEWEEYYNVTSDTIAINALPDATQIVSKLEWLIQNPDKIIEISKNARLFVEQYHDHINCAKLYLEKWS